MTEQQLHGSHVFGLQPADESGGVAATVGRERDAEDSLRVGRTRFANVRPLQLATSDRAEQELRVAATKRHVVPDFDRGSTPSFVGADGSRWSTFDAAEAKLLQRHGDVRRAEVAGFLRSQTVEQGSDDEGVLTLGGMRLCVRPDAGQMVDQRGQSIEIERNHVTPVEHLRDEKVLPSTKRHRLTGCSTFWGERNSDCLRRPAASPASIRPATS